MRREPRSRACDAQDVLPEDWLIYAPNPLIWEV
jgi:hypothetical protein